MNTTACCSVFPLHYTEILERAYLPFNVRLPPDLILVAAQFFTHSGYFIESLGHRQKMMCSH